MAESTAKHEDAPQLAAGESMGDGATDHDHGPGTRNGGMGDEDSPYRAGTESLSHTRSANPGSRCQATNKRGEPCRAPATQGRYCIAHSGRVDMKELGRKGGLSQETALRKEVRADDELRESARRVLADALSGKKNISKSALDAARSLFSYRSDAPPAQHGQSEREPLRTSKGQLITSLEDVLIFGLENPGSREAVAPMVERAHARLMELRRGEAAAW